MRGRLLGWLLAGCTLLVSTGAGCVVKTERTTRTDSNSGYVEPEKRTEVEVKPAVPDFD